MVSVKTATKCMKVERKGTYGCGLLKSSRVSGAEHRGDIGHYPNDSFLTSLMYLVRKAKRRVSTRCLLPVITSPTWSSSHSWPSLAPV